MRELTEKQKAILEFIDKFHRTERVPPTVYEIADNFGIKPATSFAHLRALQRKGYLERSSKARSITLLKNYHIQDTGPFMHVPIVGKISAGLPLLAQENIEEHINIDPALLPWGTGTRKLFALRIKGESMQDAGILDGDVVVAVQQNTAASGEVVIALVDGESTIKYFYVENHVVELRPANPAFKPQFYQAQNVQIQGIMVALFRAC